MITKKTLTFTALIASIFMVAISGTATNVQAQILGSDLHPPGASLLVILAEDDSGSLTSTGFQQILDGEQAALDAFYSQGPGCDATCVQDRFDQGITFALIQFSSTAVQIGIGGAPGNDLFTVTDQTSLDVLKAAIAGKVFSGGFTCISCVFNLADQIAANAGLDVAVLDLATDGVPEFVDDEASAKAARDAAIDGNGGNLNGVNALGIGLDQASTDFLATLVWPEPAVVGMPSATNGFVLSAETLDDFADAFEEKLFSEVILCPNGVIDPGETCDDNNSVNGDGCSATCQIEVVGGESIAINNSALLIAGLSANLSMIAPMVAGIAGASAYIIYSRMNKD